MPVVTANDIANVLDSIKAVGDDQSQPADTGWIEITDDPATPPLTEREIAEIEARANAATPGPWMAYAACSEYPIEPGVEDSTFGFNFSGPEVHHYRDNYKRSDDVIFIAKVREDILALVTEVRRLRSNNYRCVSPANGGCGYWTNSSPVRCPSCGGDAEQVAAPGE